MPENSTRTKMRPLPIFRGWFPSPLSQLPFLDPPHHSVIFWRLTEVNGRYKHRYISSEIGSPSHCQPIDCLFKSNQSWRMVISWYQRFHQPHSPDCVACDDRRHCMVPGMYRNLRKCLYYPTVNPLHRNHLHLAPWNFLLYWIVLTDPPSRLIVLLQRLLWELNSKLYYGSVYWVVAGWKPISTSKIWAPNPQSSYPVRLTSWSRIRSRCGVQRWDLFDSSKNTKQASTYQVTYIHSPEKILGVERHWCVMSLADYRMIWPQTRLQITKARQEHDSTV